MLNSRYRGACAYYYHLFLQVGGIWSSLASAVTGSSEPHTIFQTLDNDTSKIEKMSTGAWKALGGEASSMQGTTVSEWVVSYHSGGAVLL